MIPYDPAALECLAAIIDEGSFERAAERLSITQSAVSQRLRVLEAHVGAVLVVRSRPARATLVGQALLKHTKMLRLLRAEFELDIRQVADQRQPAVSSELQRVALAINADSLATWALPALDPLVQQGLSLEIIVDDQDFTSQWLRDGQVLGCVTSLHQPLRGCRAQLLGVMDYLLLASPDYARRHFGDLPLRADQALGRQLPSHCFVSHSRKDHLPEQLMSGWLGLRVTRLNQVFVPSSQGMVRAVCKGWGLSVLPRLLVADELARGELVDLLPGHSLPVALYWHCWNFPSGLVDRLTQALSMAAAKALQPSA
jgi:LysR family transcriptional regulator (chromosome initiation inhibitor)